MPRQEGVSLVEAVDVGVQAVRGAQADVVGDHDGRPGGQNPVDGQGLVTHGHGVAVEGQRVLKGEGRGALVALAHGARGERDQGARSGSLPGRVGLDVGTGHGDGHPGRVGGPVHEAGRGSRHRAAVEAGDVQPEGQGLAADQRAVFGGQFGGRRVELRDGDAPGDDRRGIGGGCRDGRQARAGGSGGHGAGQETQAGRGTAASCGGGGGTGTGSRAAHGVLLVARTDGRRVTGSTGRVGVDVGCGGAARPVGVSTGIRRDGNGWDQVGWGRWDQV